MTPDPSVSSDLTRLSHLGRLYFLHIPKTAGTSLRLWLEGLFDVEACFPSLHPFELADDPGAELARHRFFTGHHQWRFAERWGEALGLQVITFLRDPIPRGLSEMRYLRSFTPEQVELWRDRSWVLDLLPRMSDAEIVALSRFIEEWGNRQTRDLGITAAEMPAGASFGDYPNIALGERHLEAAIAHLGEMAGFGLVEEMERSALLIADALGLPARPMGLKVNVTGEAAPVPPAAVQAAFAGANGYDLRLHEAARAMFFARFEALLARHGLTDDAEGHRALAARLDAEFATRDRGVPLLAALSADMSRGMVLDGFQQRFFYEPLGRWLRWSQGATARLWLPVDRPATRRLVLDIAFFTDDATRDALTIEIDGEKAALTLDYPRWKVPAGAGESDEAYHIAVSVELPKLAHSPQYTQVSLKLPEGGGALALAGVRVE